ncbi:hypothetical protein [Nannocystis sp. SCPEA4]|uniref:hypothetical protein n=1 Tax=Nannocystis sp. SCPEA4 TaxID=2996787 RepID=UPI00226EE342|nr:hypothetical protein [Nannocystis sp. SCPEA4]MCY1058644.1 hypothetical protein [Nannocystis sp. SCPEA4]
MPSTRILPLTLLALACGPGPATTTEGSSSTLSPSTNGELPVVTTTSSSTAPTTSTTAPEPALPDLPDDGTTTTTTGPQSFITPPDGGSGCVASCQCDPWHETCGDTSKCSPASTDDDPVWDELKCVPLDPNPAHAGEPCTVAGGVLTGQDTCDLESMCLHVDPDTLVGTCVANCGGSVSDPECPFGTACLIEQDFVLHLCLPVCEPLLGDCPQGQACIHNPFQPTTFVCMPDLPGDPAPLFAGCDRLGCAPGLFCGAPQAASECDPAQPGCCLPFCDLEAPACPGLMQTCQPFFGDDPPPPLHKNVGRCTQ